MYKRFVLCITSICFWACTGFAQNWQWARSGIGDKTDEGAALATDATGNVYATGYFTSPTDIFGNDTLVNVGGNQNMFLVKYSTTGNVLWAKSGTSSSVATDVATDAFGNLYVTGFFFASSVTFSGVTLSNSGGPGTGNMFLLKYNLAGTLLWAKSATSTGDIRGASVATDTQGNIFVTGGFQYATSATFGSLTLTSGGSGSIFTAKYDATGTALWVKGGIAGGPFNAYGIAADTAGNAIIVGSYRSGNINFGGGNVTGSSSVANMYVTKYNATGTVLWVKNYGGAGGYSEAYGVATDGASNIYVTGYFNSSTVTFGAHTLSNGSFFLAKFNPSGACIWARSATNTNNDYGYNIATNTLGSVYVSGALNAGATFGNVILTVPAGTCHSSCDPLFVLQYDTSGNALCGATLASGGDDYNDVAADIFGNAFVGGDFLASPFNVGSNVLTLTHPNSGVVSENIFVAKLTPSHYYRDTAICLSSAAVLSATTANSYQWSTGANTQTITVNDTGLYWVQIQPPNGCRFIDTIHVGLLNAPKIDVIKDTGICNNVNYVLDASGANATSYIWSTGALSPSITPTVSNIYWVDMQTNISPCLVRDSATINIFTPPTITASNYTVCSGQLTAITPTVTGGSGIYTYNWGTAFSGTTYTTNVVADSLYTIAVTDLNGCVTPTDTGKITVLNVSSINLPAPVIGCKPVCLNLDSIPYTTLSNWQWIFGDGDTTNQAATTYCYSDSGSYKVSFTYTTNLGCKNNVSADSLVTVYPGPTAAFSASTFTTDILNGEINFYNESVNYVQPVQWSFGDSGKSTITNPTYNFTAAANYTITLVVQNQKGCRDTAVHELTVTEIFTFYAPNAFTPNNDGNDETFLPVGTGWDNSTFKLLVYDRWGNLILNTSNPNQGWDGKVKGHHAQEDVYVWKVEVSDIIVNRPHSYSGTVTLVK